MLLPSLTMRGFNLLPSATQQRGAHKAVVGEPEIALELGRRALDRFKVDRKAVDESIAAVRRSVAD